MTINKTIYGVFRYRETQNLGDAIQTVALSRLLPGILRGIDRRDGKGPSCTWLVANGWLGDNQLPPVGTSGSCIFAGVFLAQEHNLEWLQRSPFPIGARDPDTYVRVIQAGLVAEMIGCASLTLPLYRGRRTGIYIVDSRVSDSISRTGEMITHHISRKMSWRDQWTRALYVLDLYRRASLVYTSRLHVALPCIAFGTPVIFSCPDPDRINDPLVYKRVSLLRSLGVSDGVVAEMNVEGIANRYRAFLERHLGIKIEEHLPQFPS
jgi:hypothetical protein